jgi:hypothetical protein
LGGIFGYGVVAALQQRSMLHCHRLTGGCE